MKDKTMERRQFLKSAAATAGGLLILPSGSLMGATAPSNKLNIALIGAWGRGEAHYDMLATQNVVALCDVDETHIDHAAERFPKAKRYIDWRKCLDRKDLDAIVCCTTDHTHAFVTNWAMNRGLHVYCEKPLANCVYEARVIREKYLKNKDKIATQMGTQRHADSNFNRVRELIRDGAVGELSAVHVWGNRKIPKPGYLPAAGEPPKTLHYDLWIGPAPWHPYNPEYFSGKPQANCLQWNMYWDFGSGQVGDMGSHIMDLAWNALDAELPTSAQAEGEPFNPDVTPVMMKASFEVPANDWRPAITVVWHQGGSMPSPPAEHIDLSKIPHGVMFKGDKGFLVAGFTHRLVIPYGKDADMTYYEPRPKDQVIPEMVGFQEEWLEACKGDPAKTSCNFDYSSKFVEMMHLGLVAYRTGGKLDYDGATGRVTNNPQADALLAREYRKGWTLEG